VDEIWQTGAQRHADCGDMVEIETGSRIPIWWTFAFFKPEVVIYQPWIKICELIFDLLINVDLLKRVISSDTKQEAVLRHRGCHLENRYNIISPLSMNRFARNSAA